MILLASGSMPFSSRGRPWKILSALLLLYAGCLYHYLADRVREPPIWACEGHPEKADGRRFWLIGERITAVDPREGVLEVEPKGYRVRIHGDLPKGAGPEGRLYAVARFHKGSGFALESGARVGPPQALTHLNLYLVSIPALAFVIWVFLRRFRFTAGELRRHA